MPSAKLYYTLRDKQEQLITRFGIPGSVLKIIAIISMLIDHTAATVIRYLREQAFYAGSTDLQRLYGQWYYIMRRIGRLAFPIFCFLLVEGFLHTRNVRKYALRLFLFALISEFPFDYSLHYNQSMFAKQNVYFTLLIGLLVIWCVRELSGQLPLQLMVMSAGMILAIFLRTDYSYHGVFLIEMLYATRFSRLFQSAAGAAYMQYYEKMPTPLAFIPIYLYNGKRGYQIKYFFYIFYPLHLLVLGLITNHFLAS